MGKKEDCWLDKCPGIDSLHEQVKPQKGKADSERCIKSSFHIHGKLTERENAVGQELGWPQSQPLGRNFTRSQCIEKHLTPASRCEMTAEQ